MTNSHHPSASDVVVASCPAHPSHFAMETSILVLASLSPLKIIDEAVSLSRSIRRSQLTMPKRKRTDNEDGGRGSKSRGHGVQEKLAQSTKLLHRALKTAKGFERQKLGKRLTLATKNQQPDEIARINREIDALKNLNLDQVTNAHLYKTLLKVKAFAESDLLPKEVRTPIPKPEGPEETLMAINNVTSGMCNTKPVKDVITQAVSWMYAAMGIPVPAKGKATNTKKEVVEASNVAQKSRLSEEGSAEQVAEAGSDAESWGGLSSNENEDEADDGNEDEEMADAESLDEDMLSHYDALLGASSDEESFDEEEYKAKRTTGPQTRLSLSLSPEPEQTLTIIPAESLSPSASPEPKPRPKKPTKAKVAPVKGSTFLPSLIGGYWSGSESEASELEDFKPAARKNRRGQAERRAIAEKKFGDKAKHIVLGQGPAGKRKDDGWDAKRGAKDSNDMRGKPRGFGKDSRPQGRSFQRATGDNAIDVAPKPRGLGKKDDVGVLHPSWQAAKKAKEAKQNATFLGKKVTFD